MSQSVGTYDNTNPMLLEFWNFGVSWLSRDGRNRSQQRVTGFADLLSGLCGTFLAAIQFGLAGKEKNKPYRKR